MPPKTPPAVNSPINVPGESNPTSTPASNNVDQTIQRPSSTPGPLPTVANNERIPLTPLPSYSTIQKIPQSVLPPPVVIEATKIQAQGALSAGFESHHHKTEKTYKIEKTSKSETKETSIHEIKEYESSEITITKSLEIKERLSDFELVAGGILRVKVKYETGLFIKREIKLDDYLGFAQDGTLSWEATGFSSVTGVKIEIRGSKIFAVYKGRESYIDLFDKIRVFNGELTILSFPTRMFSQVPWMNFRILAFPTMNMEIEAMITRSTASIASSTVKTASIKLQQEISKLIETTISSVHEEINQRVRMEVECLRETMQVTMQQEMFATMQAGLVGPVDWDSLRKGVEGGKHVGVGKNEVITYTNGGHQILKPEAHPAWA